MSAGPSSSQSKAGPSTEPAPTASTSSSASNVSLHPLVIINISDHYTRMRAMRGPLRVIGCLLGIQSGRNVEIFNSFELLYDEADGFIQINSSFMRTKQEQYKKVFPNYDVLGWYSSGSEINYNTDLHIHKTSPRGVPYLSSCVGETKPLLRKRHGH
eukprot:tig00021168_g19078.t1